MPKVFRILIAGAFFSAIFAGCSAADDNGPTLTTSEGADYAPSVNFGETLGIAHGYPIEDDAESTAKREFHLREYARLGLKYIRNDFHWHRIEQSPGVYDFSHYDALVDDALENGFKYLALLVYGNTLYSVEGAANNDSAYPPDNPNHYADFAGETARHFSGRVSEYEIWNEPNSGFRFWRPVEDPAAYAELLIKAYSVIKAADPAVSVAFGGTFYQGTVTISGPDFVEAAIAANPRTIDSFDALAYHPYGFYPPSQPPELSSRFETPTPEIIAAYRRAIGDAKKDIWCTEVGWPTWGRVTEDKQAQYLVRSLILNYFGGSEINIIYNFADGSNYESFPPEGAFGLFRYDGYEDGQYFPLEKKVVAALEFANKIIGPARAAGNLRTRLGLAPSQYGYAFSSPNSIVWVLWEAEEDESSVLSFDTDAIGTVFSFYGEEITEFQHNFRPTLRNEPLYIHFNKN